MASATGLTGENIPDADHVTAEQRLGYRPNVMAHGLQGGHHHTRNALVDGSVIGPALESRLGKSRFPYDAILCACDEYGVAALAWLKSRSIRVPEDVAEKMY